MSAVNIFEIKKFGFNNNLLAGFQHDHFVNGLWPLVYILSDAVTKEAYIGETADALSRMTIHLKNNNKNRLTQLHIITSDKFNKSATLDIESNLIKYLAGDGHYKLQNGNLGLANHSYYQKEELYWDIFQHIWTALKPEGIAKKNLAQINNADLFKYSPYKSLSADQKGSLIAIIKSLLQAQVSNIIIEGGAGTGKTILAIFLFKLLQPGNEDFNFKEFESDEKELTALVMQLKTMYPNPSMALVIPMSSFRKTVQNVFSNIKGLRSNMVIGPSEVANRKFDILVVDEAHRLRQRTNLGTYFKAFDRANEKMQLNKLSGNELDWIKMQGGKNIYFYDENQSIKPSDVSKADFDKLKTRKTTLIKTLTSQFRVKAGNDYVSYINKLLRCSIDKEPVFRSKSYEFFLFDSLDKMIESIKRKEEEYGLCRIVAGFSWRWISKKDKTLFDINIDGLKLQWNNTPKDWVNSKNAINEVGCIHTTQGYDLNYTGVIFGNEITYDKSKDEIVIEADQYFDRNGKQSIKDPAELKEFIINIYKTIMLRGIRGTYIYVCNDALREYFAKHIISFEDRLPFRIIPSSKVDAYKNCIPLYDLTIAAGSFSDLQQSPGKQWIELPKPFHHSPDYFICKVIGESMNKIIPNGSWCLFKKYSGGTRDGKIVLAEHSDIQDAEFGAGYTIKLYESKKREYEGSWEHSAIVLKPQSYDEAYQDIVLKEDALSRLQVIGIFQKVL